MAAVIPKTTPWMMPPRGSSDGVKERQPKILRPSTPEGSRRAASGFLRAPAMAAGLPRAPAACGIPASRRLATQVLSKRPHPRESTPTWQFHPESDGSIAGSPEHGPSIAAGRARGITRGGVTLRGCYSGCGATRLASITSNLRPVTRFILGVVCFGVLSLALSAVASSAESASPIANASYLPLAVMSGSWPS